MSFITNLKSGDLAKTAIDKIIPYGNTTAFLKFSVITPTTSTISSSGMTTTHLAWFGLSTQPTVATSTTPGIMSNDTSMSGFTVVPHPLYHSWVNNARHFKNPTLLLLWLLDLVISVFQGYPMAPLLQSLAFTRDRLNIVTDLRNFKLYFRVITTYQIHQRCDSRS